jgi:hypothetical protein
MSVTEALIFGLIVGAFGGVLGSCLVELHYLRRRKSKAEQVSKSVLEIQAILNRIKKGLEGRGVDGTKDEDRSREGHHPGK